VTAPFAAVLAISGKRVTFLPTHVADAARDVAASVEQFCEALSLLSGPWLWEGFPVVPFQQAAELDARIWAVRP
jgi:hypothetical protein